MKDLQIFDFNSNKVRVIMKENEPWFVAKDVAEVLGYERPRNAIAAHCKGALKQGLPHPQSENTEIEMTIIPERDVYRLIMRSKLPSAEKFEEWVVGEVLPTIRKHGAYLSNKVIEDALTDPDTLIKLATCLKEERRQKELLIKAAEAQQKLIIANAPKVEYFETVLQSQGTYTTTQIAKELGMSGTTLNRKLREMRVQFYQNGTWLLYQNYQGRGYTKTKTHTFTDSEGVQRTNMLTVWTEKGRLFIHQTFKKNSNGKESTKNRDPFNFNL